MAAWDVVIVGGGSAGLSAALMLGRSRRSVLVVDGGRPRNAPAQHMHGVLGRDHTSPLDLLAAGRAELTRYDVVVESGEVADAAEVETDAGEPGGPSFEVVLDSGERHLARRLLVATGLRDELPDIPGLAEQWGRGVVLCPYCDGWEVRDRRIAVIASSAANAHQAQLMRQLSADVVFCTQGAVLAPAARSGLDARGIVVEDRRVIEVFADGGGRLRGIRLEDGSEWEADAVFVAPKAVPHDDLLRRLRARSMRQGGVDQVLVDEDGRTSVRGLYAAGNVVGAKSSVPWAMSSGSLTGAAINADLVDEDVRNALDARG
ncbi:NAD(P)/FAD-dependent oxidoreductase [Agromyces bracchium]|uniref:FAD-binding protein n=1 Tax=Agromyces bracchium TaxID=88376 RepID=A0A6I3M9A3_9MICO|nr:NAD(P)/FAD-dependent oxidoreductase [Agromyces bracchium]MTH69874.1 FAD-binding protein [Agromyces bracchium]